MKRFCTSTVRIGLLSSVVRPANQGQGTSAARKRRLVACLNMALLLLIMLSVPLLAQSNSCQIGILYYFGDTVLPGPAYCGPGQGPFSFMCYYNTKGCAPPGAAQETPACPQCVLAGKPISLSTGNTFIRQIDIRLAGSGGGLLLTRTWNSLWPSTQSGSKDGMFGSQWRSNYEERVFVGSDGYIKYSRADGSFWSFGYGSYGSWGVAAPANETSTLTQGSSYWTITFRNGEQRRFDNSSGSLITIIDRNGNTTQLSYDGLNRLTTVTDAALRHLYFQYPDSSTYHVNSVTSDVGHSVSYTYDVQGRLLQVTETDGSILSFEYDANSLISAVKDASGKILEAHTYDSAGRGLSSSRANGVESLTVSYP